VASAGGILEEDSVALWFARPAQLEDPAVADHYTGLMSDEERERGARLLVDGARQLHLVARALQRVVLAWYLPGVEPHELRFVRGGGGRPSLAAPFDAGGLDFNLAHTQGLVVLAVARGLRFGIDVERYDKNVPLAAARRYFSNREVAALEGLPPAAQPWRFLRLWTLKEAYLKALGRGISGGLGSATFHIDSRGVSFECASDPDASRWWFGQFTAGTGHLLAVACQSAARRSRASPSLEYREFLAGRAQTPSFAIAPLDRDSGDPSGQEHRSQS
jgi:4'-phosphopantetheinyl transferase